MVDRREALHRLSFTGAFAALTQRDAGFAGDAQDSAAGMSNLTAAVRGIRDEMAHEFTFWEIAPVRDPLRTFLRTNGKFPEYIEVGTDIWQQVYDWHVRYQQPINTGRTPDTRYTIRFMETTVIMRQDLTPTFVGIPYDYR